MASASETYWTLFNVTDKDVERVYAYMLEKGEAVSTPDLARLSSGRARMRSKSDMPASPQKPFCINRKCLLTWGSV